MNDDNLLHENGACPYNEECTGLWKLCNICEIARKTEKKAVELGQRFDSLHDNLTVKMKGGETNE